MSKVTEQVVREVIANTYGVDAVQDDAELVEVIVTTLETPEKGKPVYEGAVSPAAFDVRFALWGYHAENGRQLSARATVVLFHALSREDELGWVAELAETGELAEYAI